jgi:hypothetical protein
MSLPLIRSLHALAALSLTCATIAAADTWDFQPPKDEFKADALMDLRFLNEQTAGESGFIKRSPDGNDFVLGNGKPIRFWALMDGAASKHPRFPAPDLAVHARFLAKRGINLVRVFGDISSDKTLDGIDTELRDQLWRTVAAMKKEGIYVLFTPIWIGNARTNPGLGFLDTGGAGKWGSLCYDHQLQDAYKAWMKQVLTEKNPYTGIPLCDDPGLAIIQIQNEDSLLWWSAQSIKGAGKAELRRQFYAFLEKKYGSFDKAQAAWQGAAPPGNQDAPDDATAHEAALYIVWELTQHRGGPGEDQRTADQMEFIASTMHGFYTMIGDYFHNDLHCKQLVNASNWRTADNVTMLDAERWSYSGNEVMAVNRYYTGIHNGANCGWAICNGDQLTDESVLTKPRSLPVTLKQVEGYPMIITESSWVPPLSYQSEGPALIAAYQSLNGVDAYFWFATGEETWNDWSVDSANGYMPSQGKWICATPMLMGQWPAAALLYRMNYLKQGEPAVVEQRTQADLWRRGMPIIAEDEGYDPNRDQGLIAKNSSVKDGVNPLAYQVGPVEVKYGGDPTKSKVLDLKPYIDEGAKTVRSDTDQLKWDYGNGFCTIDAPKAQGATGFFQKVGGSAKLKDVDITCGNDYATILVVALDNKPLSGSGRILVQIGTREHTTGWQTEPSTIKVDKSEVQGERIISYGHLPWQIEKSVATITIRNPALTKATGLDCNGMPHADVPLQRTADGVTCTLPPDVLYVVVQ